MAEKKKSSSRNNDSENPRTWKRVGFLLVGSATCSRAPHAFTRGERDDENERERWGRR